MQFRKPEENELALCGIILVVITVCSVFFFFVGKSCGRIDTKNEAVRMKVATYGADEVGASKFQWITENKEK